MSQTAHHYLIFETAGGFCGIAWNKVGITRFQLPTRSTEATERILRRRIFTAEPGAPTPEVVEAVAAVKRYFEGEAVDFSGFRLDLGEQDAFFKRIYAAARRVGWGHTTTYGALAKELGAGPEAARDVGQGHCQINFCGGERSTRRNTRITLRQPHFSIDPPPRLGRSGASSARRDGVEG